MMLKHGFFSFHIVDSSPWPLYMSAALFTNMVSMLNWFSGSELINISSITSFIFTILVFYGWMKDIVYESFLQGMHTKDVQKGLKLGMVLFITSEVMFFFSFFWSLFYFSVNTHIQLDGWPPAGISSIDPMKIPLMGTLILISSGVTITWSHHSVLENNKSESIKSLIITIALGAIFTMLQLNEYYETSFCINDSVYGSIFFLSTGFHGLHVLVGTLFLMACLFRMIKDNFSMSHHVGYELAIWYWHFVDVVWLFLYIFVYLWSD
uniref:Cytochrome c oxidase subunit 3 n=1 Tax=Plegadiphilus threskiornis TaxID=2965265 RepID=A0A9Y2DXW0_9NEOP|nr:cytochrome c oxidase subunit III [Plegadiphilus threskiornis]WIM51533.1 cytochrome c oxidase subunit 3 [Plegadiphilus threskiornis]